MGQKGVRSHFPCLSYELEICDHVMRFFSNEKVAICRHWVEPPSVRGALISFHHILAEVHLKDVLTHLHNIPWRFQILVSLCVGGSYFAITGYDVLDLRHLGRSLPYATTASA